MDRQVHACEVWLELLFLLYEFVRGAGGFQVHLEFKESLPPSKKNDWFRISPRCLMSD